MANAFLDAKTYANVMLTLLKNQLVLGKLVDGRFKDEATTENGARQFVKAPPRFVAKTGAALAQQDMVVREIELNVNQYKNVHVGITDIEGYQSWNALMKSEVMKSAASTLAHDVDLYLASLFKQFASEVGTPGDLIQSPQQFNKAHTRLMNQSAPNSDLKSVISFDDGELIRGNLIGTDISQINRSALERVRIPILSEIDVYASQNLSSVTNGTRSSTAGEVDGASQNVNYTDAQVRSDYTQVFNLKTLGAAATVSAGETFTIAGVFAVNQRTQQVLPYLQQFSVVTGGTADGTGDLQVTITPPIIVPGTGGGTLADVNTAHATVSAAPLDSADITFAGAASATRVVKAAFHRQAIAMISQRLIKPATGESDYAVDPDTGISIRAWRGSDFATGVHGWRFDMVYGASMMDPYLGVRLNGTAP